MQMFDDVLWISNTTELSREGISSPRTFVEINISGDESVCISVYPLYSMIMSVIG